MISAHVGFGIGAGAGFVIGPTGSGTAGAEDIIGWTGIATAGAEDIIGRAGNAAGAVDIIGLTGSAAGAADIIGLTGRNEPGVPIVVAFTNLSKISKNQQCDLQEAFEMILT